MGNGRLVGYFPLPSRDTKGPCDITLPPAVMSEATTKDLSRQMARGGAGGGGGGQGKNTCILVGDRAARAGALVSQMAGNTEITLR